LTVRTFVLCAVLGCQPGPRGADAPASASPEPAALPATPTPPRARVADPKALADFLPARLDGRTPIAREVTDARVAATWETGSRTLTVSLSRIVDLHATTSPLELLGLDVVATMGGHELRGLRFQGNPAQVRRQLDPPNRATLDVVAVSTYHVVVTVEPTASLDDALQIGDQLDIGGLTLLALAEHKARTAGGPPEDPTDARPPHAPPEEPR
jgi:hypothetical protein